MIFTNNPTGRHWPENLAHPVSLDELWFRYLTEEAPQTDRTMEVAA